MNAESEVGSLPSRVILPGLLAVVPQNLSGLPGVGHWRRDSTSCGTFPDRKILFPPSDRGADGGSRVKSHAECRAL